MIVKELDLTGKSLSNYKIIGKLGKGGIRRIPNLLNGFNGKPGQPHN